MQEIQNRVPRRGESKIVNTPPDLVIAVDSSTTASKAVIWDRHGQAVAEGRAHKILDVHACLVWQLTGLWKTSWACADPMGQVDMRSFSWSSELLQALDLDRAQYVELAPPGAVLGEVTEAAARATGLPAGL